MKNKYGRKFQMTCIGIIVILILYTIKGFPDLLFLPVIGAVVTLTTTYLGSNLLDRKEQK
jgi:hypothetical protein